ncbi:MAG: ABC transporter permease [Pseudomonadota bacterium]
MAERRQNRTAAAVLQVRDLHVYYGQSHALQGVDLTLENGVHAVVGRNGMGKTTLCNAIMGLLPVRRGAIRFHGTDITAMAPYKIAAQGIAYTPQGRRLWPSLTVEEHLRLGEVANGAWTMERIYETFPRLFERRRNGAGQLSGGEQQMLAISRALLQDPQLLVLDEPTEGLAPVIVDQVERLLAELAESQDVAILLIEQNISVATAIAEDVAIMVNGRINRVLPAAQLAADRALQERLLGVGRHSHEDAALAEPAAQETSLTPPPETPVETAKPNPLAGDEREEAGEPLPMAAPANLVYVPPTRWSDAAWQEGVRPAADPLPDDFATTLQRPFDVKPTPLFDTPTTSTGAALDQHVYLAGTFDTKGMELNFIRDRLLDHGLRVRCVDLSTSGKPSSVEVPPHVVAAYYRGGPSRVLTGDRGDSVRAMADAFETWLGHQRDVGGLISAGGSGGTALVTPAMRRLPVGVPKIMISTVASGEVGQYVGPSDIMMMYSVTDVQGLNQISKRILANGANAMAGMVKEVAQRQRGVQNQPDKPSLGLTMFGVTTTAVQQITEALEDRYECMVFHATGTGGRSMEKLADSGLLSAVVDLTTTEICDMMMGGVFAADEDRFGAFIRTQIPYVGSVGAVDMVNFGPRDTVPAQYKSRTFVEHNPQVTLMRTTPEENAKMGKWIAGRLNLMRGPVRFLLPEGGVSALDKPGQAFHDPAADQALFDAITQDFIEASNRRLLRVPHHINDPAFTAATVTALSDIDPILRTRNYATL